jgi:hypothetical protein
MTTVTEPLPAEVKIARANERIEVATASLQRLKEIRQWPNLTPAQVTKLDTIIPKVETFLTNQKTIISNAQKELVTEEIDEAIANLQEMIADANA